LTTEREVRTAGAIILRISHGYRVKEKDDPFVKVADEATEQFSLSTAPGGFLVNLIPQRGYLASLELCLSLILDRSEERPRLVPRSGF
jgi:hypothetical protein